MGVGLEPSNVIGARFTLECEALGLAAPPFALRVRFVDMGDEWCVYVMPPPNSPAGPIVDWLAPTAPRRLDLEAEASSARIFPNCPPTGRTSSKESTSKCCGSTPTGTPTSP